MILDEDKISELLGNNKENETMENSNVTWTGSSDVSGKLDRLLLSSCEKSHVISDAVHESGYKTLVDGGLTRKNDDDNTKHLSTLNTVGFNGVEKSLADFKYEVAKEMCGMETRLSTQATVNYNALDKAIVASSTQALIMDKDNQIRLQEMKNIDLRESAAIARDAHLEKSIAELKAATTVTSTAPAA